MKENSEPGNVMNIRKRIYPIIALVAITALLICIVFFSVTIKMSTEKNREFLEERNEESVSFISMGMRQVQGNSYMAKLVYLGGEIAHQLSGQTDIDAEKVFDVFENEIGNIKGKYDSIRELIYNGALFAVYRNEIYLSKNDSFRQAFGYDPTMEMLEEDAVRVLKMNYCKGSLEAETLEEELSVDFSSSLSAMEAPFTAFHWDCYEFNNGNDMIIVGLWEPEAQAEFLSSRVKEIIDEEKDELLSSETAFLTKALIILGVSMASLIIIIIIVAYLISRKVATPIEDRIEKSEAENKVLTEMDRVKTRALSEVAHELKTPLSVISAYSEAVLQQVRQIPECDDSDHMLELIKNESNHMALTVSQVLDLTRIEEGRFTLERRICHIDTVITNAVEIYFPMLNNRGNRLKLKVPCDLPNVNIDSTRITRVIINLLTNAIKATENNLITISAEDDCDYIKVMVSDTGCGIPEDALPHIFERYYKLDQSGTGLGLYIVKTIVEAHGGTVEASSVVGEGTTFTFTVPVAGADFDETVEV